MRSWTSFNSVTRYFIAIVLGFLGFRYFTSEVKESLEGLWRIGFGTVKGNNLLRTKYSPMATVLLANTPQLILTYLYLAMNSILTHMFIGREWSSYTTQRKALRVSRRRGQQRGTYWLSIPFRFAIPIATLSVLFHWLASQSLFTVQITVTDAETRGILTNESISTCGFSPLAIALTIVLAFVLAVGSFLLGYIKKYPSGIPLAGSCSAAISAACHPDDNDIGASEKPVQWGAISHGESGEDVGEPLGHCTFSSLSVEPPIPGRLYA